MQIEGIKDNFSTGKNKIPVLEMDELYSYVKKNRIKSGTAVDTDMPGGIDSNRCTWSGLNPPLTIVTSFAVHTSRINSLVLVATIPVSTRYLYLVQNTT